MLPHEDPAEFDALLTALITELGAQGTLGGRNWQGAKFRQSDGCRVIAAHLVIGATCKSTG